MGPLAQVGLALATSIGAWINLGLVVWFGLRHGHTTLESVLGRSAAKLAVAGLALALALWLAQYLLAAMGTGPLHRDIALLAALAAVGTLAYGAVVLALFGPQWLAILRRRSAAAAVPPTVDLGSRGG
jgi:putative peptidoglycan lipid II flippase